VQVGLTFPPLSACRQTSERDQRSVMVSSMRALAVLGTALLALTVVSGKMQDTPVLVWGRLPQLLGGRARDIDMPLAMRLFAARGCVWV